jgi:tetratricopeptide (TPR) repeat protein
MGFDSSRRQNARRVEARQTGIPHRLGLCDEAAESIHAAHAILTRAAGLHPTDATIHFNLACYESQLGNLDRAKAHLTWATEIDDKFGRMALDGPDLEPLWDSLATEQGT